MKIAFITYEYPPDIAQGGIATYVMQVSKILSSRGHSVEIFCGSHVRTISENINGILIHRCKVQNPSDFQHACLSMFIERNLEVKFDIIESPEINANALKIKEYFPHLPMVVKLHMPLYVQMRLFNFYTSFYIKSRFFLGGLRRGRVRKFGFYNYTIDEDYKITLLADAIVSPSKSLKEIITSDWKIARNRINVIPYPFEPSANLLAIPIENTNSNVVTFVGKLNVHKGIVNLVKAVPLVVKEFPNVIFNFIGNDSNFTAKKMLMSQYIKNCLQGLEKNYKIKGGLVYEEVLKEYENATICIFPSIWENFPLVCLEAMSAGKPIIGSMQGGMNEMLSDGAGILVDPLNVKQIANAICNLLNNEKLRNEFGIAARKKVLANYNSNVIGVQIEKHYREVIDAKN